MKKLVMAALVAALCAVPAAARAETPTAPADPAAPARCEAQAADGQPRGCEDGATEYAERERAAADLGEFSGGADGIYIGAGALAAALIVVLIIAAL